MTWKADIEMKGLGEIYKKMDVNTVKLMVLKDTVMTFKKLTENMYLFYFVAQFFFPHDN